MIIAGASQALVLIHPTVTMTMVKLFSCAAVLGYQREWLKADVRYQCMDGPWWTFASVSISMIGIFTIGLPVIMIVSLVRARHRLNEARLVVRRRYKSWRKREKEKVLQRRVALLRGEVPEPLVDDEEEAMTNKDILSVYLIYYRYVREWDQFLFLHRDFRIEFYYWELVEIMRKLLLVSVVVVIGSQFTGYDLVFGITVLALFFAMHLYALPYKHAKHNFLKAAEMFAEYTTLFITMLMQLSRVQQGMDPGQMGLAMLAVQGIIGGGFIMVLFRNLKEGIAELKRQREQEEGLGIVARVEQVSIYSVFFAINLISGLIRRAERKRAKELDATTVSASSRRADSKKGGGEFDKVNVQRWEALARKAVAGEEDGEEMLLQHALREHGAEDDDDLDASDQASEGSVMSLDMLSDESDSSTTVQSSGSSQVSAEEAQEGEDQDDQETRSRQTAGGGNFSEEGVGIDRMDCV